MSKSNTHRQFTRQHQPGAGFFAQAPSKTILPSVIDAEKVIDDMEVVEKLIKTFITCSGMHQLENDVAGVKTGNIDEVVLQGLLLGPKATLEDFCAIMNNNAVYASLFLSSTLGLLFAPPDCVVELPNDDGGKLVFFFGICLSVFFNILNVLGAVQIYVAKHKLLRESDALKFLAMSSNAILLSGVFMTLGIIGLVLAVFPVIDKTYGRAPLVFSVCLFFLIIPYVFSNGVNYLRRHAYFYYMAKGRQAAAQGHPPNVVSDDQHDPYDPTIAWTAFREWVRVGAALAGRDADRSNLVDVTEMEMAEQLLQEEKNKTIPDGDVDAAQAV